MKLGFRSRPANREVNGQGLGSPVGGVPHLQVIVDKIRKSILYAQHQGVNHVESFAHFDTDKSGTISADEFSRGLTDLGIVLAPQHIHALVEKYGIKKRGQLEKEVPYTKFLDLLTSRPGAEVSFPINNMTTDEETYEESGASNGSFSTAIAQLQQLGKSAIEQAVDHDIWVSFERHDTMNSGRITYKNFVESVNNLGLSLSAQAIDELADQFGDHRGVLDEEKRIQVRYRDFLGFCLLGEENEFKGNHEHLSGNDEFLTDASRSSDISSDDEDWKEKRAKSEANSKLREIIRIARRRRFDYRDVFEEFDKDFTGTIDRLSFEEGLRKIGLQLTQLQLDYIVKFNEASDGVASVVDYRSLLMHLQDEEILISETLCQFRNKVNERKLDRNRMIACFEAFDRENNGVVDTIDFTTVLTRLGLEASDQQLERVMDAFKRDVRFARLNSNQNLLNGLVINEEPNKRERVSENSIYYDAFSTKSMDSYSPRSALSPEKQISKEQNSPCIMYKEFVDSMLDNEATQKDTTLVLRNEVLQVLTELRKNVSLAAISGISLDDCFKLYDVDGNGDIDSKEMHQVLHSLGLSNTSFDCASELVALFETKPGSNVMNYFDFVSMVQQRGQNESFRLVDKFSIVQLLRQLVDQAILEGNSYRKCFSDFDTESNGVISPVELLRGLRMLHVFVPEEEIQRVMDQFATDQRGMCYVDFLLLLGIKEEKARNEVVMQDSDTGLLIDTTKVLTEAEKKVINRVMSSLKECCARAGSTRIQELFEDFDHDFSGLIDEFEFMEGVKSLGIEMSQQNLRLLLRRFELYEESSLQDGIIQVHYAKFLQHIQPAPAQDNHLERIISQIRSQVEKLVSERMRANPSLKQNEVFESLLQPFITDSNSMITRAELYRGLLEKLDLKLTKSDARRVMRLLESPVSSRRNSDDTIYSGSTNLTRSDLGTSTEDVQTQWSLNFAEFKEMCRPLTCKVVLSLSQLAKLINVVEPKNNPGFKAFLSSFEQFDEAVDGTVSEGVFAQVLENFGWCAKGPSEEKQPEVPTSKESKLLKSQIKTADLLDHVLDREQLSQVKRWFMIRSYVNYRSFIRYLQQTQSKANPQDAKVPGSEVGSRSISKVPQPSERLRMQDETFKRLLWKLPASEDKDIDLYESNFVFKRSDIGKPSDNATKKQKEVAMKSKKEYQRWKLQKDVVDRTDQRLMKLGDEWAEDPIKFLKVCVSLTSTELYVRFHDVGIGSLQPQWIKWCKEYRTFENVSLSNRPNLLKLLKQGTTDPIPDELPLLRYNKDVSPSVSPDFGTRQALALNRLFVKLCKEKWDHCMKETTAKVLKSRAVRRLKIHESLVNELNESDLIDAEENDDLWYLPQFADAGGMKETLKLLKTMGPTHFEAMIQEQEEITENHNQRKESENKRRAAMNHEQFVRKKDRLRIHLPRTDKQSICRPPPMRIPCNPNAKHVVTVPRVAGCLNRTSADIGRNNQMSYCHATNIGDLENSRKRLLEQGYVLKSNYIDEDGTFDQDRYDSDFRRLSISIWKRKVEQERAMMNLDEYSLWKEGNLALDDALSFIKKLPTPSSVPKSMQPDEYWSKVGKSLKLVNRQKFFGQFVKWSKGYKSRASCQQFWRSIPPHAELAHPLHQFFWDRIKCILARIASRKDVQFEKTLESLATDIQSKRKGDRKLHEKTYSGNQGKNLEKLYERMQRYLKPTELEKYMCDLGFLWSTQDLGLLLKAFALRDERQQVQQSENSENSPLFDCTKFFQFTRARMNQSNQNDVWRSEIWKLNAPMGKYRKVPIRWQVYLGLKLANAPDNILESVRSNTSKQILTGLICLSVICRKYRLQRTKPRPMPQGRGAQKLDNLKLKARFIGHDQLILSWSSLTEVSRNQSYVHNPEILFYSLEVTEDSSSEHATVAKDTKVVLSLKDPPSRTSPPTAPRGETQLKNLKPSTTYFVTLSVFFGKHTPPVVMQKKFVTLACVPPTPVVCALRMGHDGATCCTLDWSKRVTKLFKVRNDWQEQQNTEPKNTHGSTAELAHLPAVRSLFRKYSTKSVLQGKEVKRLLPLCALNEEGFLNHFAALVSKGYTGEQQKFPSNGMISHTLTTIGRRYLLNETRNSIVHNDSGSKSTMFTLVIKKWHGNCNDAIPESLWSTSTRRSAYILVTLIRPDTNAAVSVYKSKPEPQPKPNEPLLAYLLKSSVQFKISEISNAAQSSAMNPLFKFEVFVCGGNLAQDVPVLHGELNLGDWCTNLSAANNWKKDYIVSMASKVTQPSSDSRKALKINATVGVQVGSPPCIVDESKCLTWEGFQEVCKMSGFIPLTSDASPVRKALSSDLGVGAGKVALADASFMCKPAQAPKHRTSQRGVAVGNSAHPRRRSAGTQRANFELLCESVEYDQIGSKTIIRRNKSTLYFGSSTRCVVSGLSLGTTFRFQVREMNTAAKWSDPSPPVVVSALISRPNKVVLLSQPSLGGEEEALDSTKVFKLQWEDFRDIVRRNLLVEAQAPAWAKTFVSWESKMDTSSAHVVYVLRVSRDSGPYRIAYQGTRPETALTDLAPNSCYRISVRVEDRGNIFSVRSPWSPTLEVRTAPSPPSQPAVVSLGSSDIVLRWLPGENAATKYEVESKFMESLGQVCLPDGTTQTNRSTVRRSGPWQKVFSGSQPTCHLRGLFPSSAYRFRVFAVNSDGVRSARSSLPAFTTTLDSPHRYTPQNASNTFTVRCNDDVVVGDAVLFTERVDRAKERAGKAAIGIVKTRKQTGMEMKTIYRTVAARVLKISNTSLKGKLRSSKYTLEVIWSSVTHSKNSKSYKLKPRILIHRKHSEIQKSSFGVYRAQWVEEDARRSLAEEMESRENELAAYRLQLKTEKKLAQDEWQAFYRDRERECQMFKASVQLENQVTPSEVKCTEQQNAEWDLFARSDTESPEPLDLKVEKRLKESKWYSSESKKSSFEFDDIPSQNTVSEKRRDGLPISSSGEQKYQTETSPEKKTYQPLYGEEQFASRAPQVNRPLDSSHLNEPLDSSQMHEHKQIEFPISGTNQLHVERQMQETISPVHHVKDSKVTSSLVSSAESPERTSSKQHDSPRSSYSSEIQESINSYESVRESSISSSHHSENGVEDLNDEGATQKMNSEEAVKDSHSKEELPKEDSQDSELFDEVAELMQDSSSGRETMNSSRVAEDER